jgi:putative oxygen-independent coproporphyrinogen III oxidase
VTAHSGSGDLQAPLALYIHTPWCVRKCPYCDFNSHAGTDEPPFERYIEQLLADLDQDLRSPAAQRALTSIFIGGGTPSLFPGHLVRRLLDGVRARMDLDPAAEITLEANPGTADARHFAAYRMAGVNRLSIGVQSLSSVQLRQLGRIHDPIEARRAVAVARDAGFDNLNLDMMFALSGQTLAEAADDLDALIDLAPEHLSYYQLTLEPDTAFHAQPPDLPDGDLAADMAEQGIERLATAGYQQYEVSAHAQPGRQCRHNLNYWRFGDYLGIGAGAHGKLSERYCDGRPLCIWRTAKRQDPGAYLSSASANLISRQRELSADDCLFEFALNALRLTEGVERELFVGTTGLPWARIEPVVEAAISDGLLDLCDDRLRPSTRGRDVLDELVARFAPVDVSA